MGQTTKLRFRRVEISLLKIAQLADGGARNGT